MMSILDSLINAIRGAHEPVKTLPHPSGDGQILVLRDGDSWRSKIDRGPTRTVPRHEFSDLTDFCSYVAARFKPEPCELLVDGLRACVTAYQDPHRAELDDRVSCSLPKHPAYVAWNEMSGWHSQQEVVEHLRGFGDYVLDEGGKEWLLSLFQQLGLTAREEWTSEVDGHGRIVVRSASTKEAMSSRLPTSVDVEVPIYRGVLVGDVEPVYTLELLIGMEKDEKGRPLFRFTCPRLPLVLHDALGDVVLCLRERLPGTLIGRGVAKVDEVPAL